VGNAIARTCSVTSSRAKIPLPKAMMAGMSPSAMRARQSSRSA
jgi:hypothetical protein